MEVVREPDTIFENQHGGQKKMLEMVVRAKPGVRVPAAGIPLTLTLHYHDGQPVRAHPAHSVARSLSRPGPA